MNTIEKGKAYPFHNNANGMERPVLETNTGFFDVLLYSQDAKSDAKFWGKSPVKLYVVILESIPFVAVRFPKENFDFDVSMNFLKVKEDYQETWLNTKGNIINLVLIDASTNIVKGMRMLSVDFGDTVREACRAQRSTYTHPIEIDKKISAIQAKYSTQQLISMTR